MTARAGSVCLLLLLLVPGGFQAQTQPPQPLALTGGRIIDLRTGEVTSGATIVVRDGRIESIGQGPPPAGISARDLGGRYVLPGFVDAHVHIATLAAARTALESGVTTARSGGVAHYVDVGIRELVRSGRLAGPDLLAAGYHVRPPMAAEFFLDHPALYDLRDGVTTPEAIRRVVAANLARGADVIKAVATERAGTPDTDPRKQVYTEVQLKAAVDEAAARGIGVFAHAHGDEGAAAAVRAGVRSIEHGTYLSDATLALMRERGTFLVPTYAIVLDVAQPGGDYDHPGLQVRGRHMLDRVRDTVQRAHRLGVRIVAATDTGYGPNSVTRVAQEMAELAGMGLTPLEALRSGTVEAAELLGVRDRTGALEQGLEADLVVVDRNPLEDLRTLGDVLLVVSNGRIALDRLQFGAEPQASGSSR